jgi:hypothetical protein
MSGSSEESLVVGGSARLVARLTDYSGAPVSPEGIRLLVLRPNTGVSFLQSVAIVDGTAVGVIELDTPGMWRFRFETTAPPVVAYEGHFSVARRMVPPLADS